MSIALLLGSTVTLAMMVAAGMFANASPSFGSIFGYALVLAISLFGSRRAPRACHVSAFVASLAMTLVGIAVLRFRVPYAAAVLAASAAGAVLSLQSTLGRKRSPAVALGVASLPVIGIGAWMTIEARMHEAQGYRYPEWSTWFSDRFNSMAHAMSFAETQRLGACLVLIGTAASLASGLWLLNRLFRQTGTASTLHAIRMENEPGRTQEK